ncbi:MAG: DUF342 domain-containing protein [Kiritimatiellae bacterium]|nr:DUF342 domain-containing protein [Kiritimatiellia bacterium]
MTAMGARGERAPGSARGAALPGDAEEQALGVELFGLIAKAVSLLPGDAGASEIPGVIRALKAQLESETDVLRKQHLTSSVNDLRAYFFAPSHQALETGPGQVLVAVSLDEARAVLTVTPPRGEGSMPTLNKVRVALDKARVRHGVDMSAVESALRIVREERDVVWRLTVASGEPPIPGRPRRIEYQARMIEKDRFRTALQEMPAVFAGLGNPVAVGDTVGRILPAEAGIAGTNVRGEPLVPPRQSGGSFDLGEDVQLAKDTLVARAQGHVVVDGTRIDVIPFYVVRDPAPGATADLKFPGAVLVLGNLQGPGAVECEDLYVVGNCEQMALSARGDVFISGGVVGHHKSTIDADGAVYASFVSEADVTALGPVIVTNAIINSHITSNDSVRVTSEKGIITGGTVQALKEIVARTVGSEFGMLTETVVGKDFLTAKRLAQIHETIVMHEENLRRIQGLKVQMAKARVNIDELPPDKQEIYIGVLRKESQSQADLHSLERRKKRLNASLNEFLSASVQVLDSLYPPVRIQIVDNIREIKRKLNAVTLKYDADLGIVSTFEEEQGGPK